MLDLFFKGVFWRLVPIKMGGDVSFIGIVGIEKIYVITCSNCTYKSAVDE